MKRSKKLAAMLLALSLAVPNTGGLLQVKAAEEAADAQISVEARYSSNHIRWKAMEGASAYDVLRADTENGEFKKVSTTSITAVEGTEKYDYIDETAGTGTHYYYKVQAVGTDGTAQGSSTEAVSDTYATGIDALQKHAEEEQIHYDFAEEEGGREFDGTRVVSASEEEVTSIKEMSEGTILITFKSDGASSREALFDAKNSAELSPLSGTAVYDGLAIFQESSDGMRFNVGTSSMKWNLTGLESDKWETFTLRSGAYTYTDATYNVIYTLNDSSGGFTDRTGDYTGLFTRASDIDTLTIGGAKNGEENVIPFTGEIAYVTVTDEVLSKTELAACTLALTARIEQESEVKSDKIAVTAKAAYSSENITWNAVKDAVAYKVLRAESKDGEYEEVANLGEDARSYTDTEVEKEKTYYYKVAACGSNNAELAESEAAADAAVGMEALKKNAALTKEFADGEDTFDGTRVVDVSENAEAVHGVNTGSIIFRIKVDTDVAANATILAAKVAGAAPVLDSNSNCTSFFLPSSSNFRFVYQHTKAALNAPNPLTDGDWHCIILGSNSTGKVMRLTIDGQEVWSNAVESNKGLFAKQTTLDEVTIGGHLGADKKSVVNGFKGKISQIIVTSEELSDEDAIEISKSLYSGVYQEINAMFDTSLDNTWVFTGGKSVQGGFDQTRGIRNYIGQFEEYIRWTKSGGNGDSPQRMRYTINTGKAGLTLADVVKGYENFVKKYDPKAAVYMVGEEDYTAGENGIAQFKSNLKTFIENSVALKEGNKGFAVIQEPFATKDSTANTNIEKYCAAIEEVIKEYKEQQPEIASRVVIVGHYAQTNNDTFKNTCLKDDTTLNARGHFEIGKQLSAATIKTTDGYPGQNVTLDLKEMPQPEVYLEVQPEVTASDSSLSVKVPDGNGTNWSYKLEMEGITVEGTADSNNFEITGLTKGKSYVLIMRSADGKKQLTTMKGEITNGKKAVVNTQELSAVQQKIADRMAKKDPVTWLFMGDSITHAALWTHGYDGIAQIFEKFIKDGLGREDDIVINTAVSSAATQSTLDTIEYRLEKYTPDIVSIMLGTNDSALVTADVYKTNLQTIVNKIRALNKDAIIIFRTPTACWNGRQTTIPNYIAKMKEVADATENSIYVEQFADMQKAIEAYTWLQKQQLAGCPMFGNNLHPGADGHLIMARKFIEGCGLWTEDTEITNLFYDLGIEKQTSAVKPSVQVSGTQLQVVKSALAGSSNLTLGHIILTATDTTNNQSYSVTSGLNDTVVTLKDLPNDRVYTVKVVAYQTGAAAKEITFALQQVTVGNPEEVVKPEPEKPDLSALHALKEEYASYDASKYTEESWNAFAAEMEKLEEAIAEGGDMTQAEVDALEKELSAALKAASEALKVNIPYEDVTEGRDWYYGTVADVFEKGLMTGKSATIFAPTENLVRAQFAVIIWRLEKEPEMAYDSTRFPDVADKQFYTTAVLWAADKKIVNGYTNTGLFGPSDNITREQMAVMMYRYAEWKGYDVSNTKELSEFPDADSVSGFAKDAMKWCVAEGIITGDKGNLNPQGNTNRAECATIISRFAEKYNK